MAPPSVPYRNRRERATTSPEAREAVDARIAALEFTVGSLRASSDLVVRPTDPTDDEAADVVARLRHLEAVLALEDLDP